MVIGTGSFLQVTGQLTVSPSVTVSLLAGSVNSNGIYELASYNSIVGTFGTFNSWTVTGGSAGAVRLYYGEQRTRTGRARPQ